jgi:hypothetical protein
MTATDSGFDLDRDLVVAVFEDQVQVRWMKPNQPKPHVRRATWVIGVRSYTYTCVCYWPGSKFTTQPMGDAYCA